MNIAQKWANQTNSTFRENANLMMKNMLSDLNEKFFLEIKA